MNGWWVDDDVTASSCRGEQNGRRPVALEIVTNRTNREIADLMWCCAGCMLEPSRSSREPSRHEVEVPLVLAEQIIHAIQVRPNPNVHRGPVDQASPSCPPLVPIPNPPLARNPDSQNQRVLRVITRPTMLDWAGMHSIQRRITVSPYHRRPRISRCPLPESASGNLPDGAGGSSQEGPHLMDSSCRVVQRSSSTTTGPPTPPPQLGCAGNSHPQRSIISIITGTGVAVKKEGEGLGSGSGSGALPVAQRLTEALGRV